MRWQNAAIGRVEEAQHGGHARLQLVEEDRRANAHTQQQFFDCVDIEQGISQRFRAAADMPAIGQDLRRTLRLEHGEASFEDLASVFGRRARQGERNSDAEAHGGVGFLRRQEL